MSEVGGQRGGVGKKTTDTSSCPRREHLRRECRRAASPRQACHPAGSSGRRERRGLLIWVRRGWREQGELRESLRERGWTAENPRLRCGKLMGEMGK